MIAQSYLYSHLAPEKGYEYDQMYRTDQWLKYVWQRGQATLLNILENHFRGRRIKLLDFACGTGRITSFLEDKVDEAVGVDVSESMLCRAARKVKRTKLLKVNLLEENLLEGEKFDLITAFRFFPNAEPALRHGALKVITGLLSDGGLLVLNNHINRYSMFYTYYRLKRTLLGNTAPRTFSMRECRKMLHGFDLKIVRVYSVGLVHIPRYHLPQSLYQEADNLGCCSNWLGSCSESPIIVCRSGS